MSPRTTLPRDVQGPNAWLNVIACSGAQNIRSLRQNLDRKRYGFCVGAGLALSEGLGCALQDINVVLFSLLTEPNCPTLSHAPAIAFEATDAK